MKEKNDKSILIGVTGGIASIKTALLVSDLAKKGFSVYTILTEAACKFVTPLTFSTISRNPAKTDMFPSQPFPAHLEPKELADYAAIIPATANFLGKLAHGIADDLLTTVLLSFKPEHVMIAPAMNPEMWKNPAVQANSKILAERGYYLIRPATGKVACGDEGEGRLPEIDDLNLHIEKMMQIKDLCKERIVITLGSTMEYIDPVRVITNHSSGKMGLEIAKEAFRRGAKVTLVSGRCETRIPEVFDNHDIRTAIELQKKLFELMEYSTGLIMVAAVADLKPKQSSVKKLKRKDHSIQFIANDDIIASIARKYRKLKTVAFSLQEDLEDKETACTKLKGKNVDMIIANEFSTMGSELSKIRIITGKNEFNFKQMSKADCAKRILDKYAGIKK
ncbi:MAG: bifunctional phosphopantothenoylcysteine decarboxylase/phosphopantothenate--cysteine ligase CoaBC [Candidatus Coatesbacteria bacterium]|nr:bifunctional phosphopantothenoylcysteine decarboxylase/phosphopantothenate--cysteine ligase CoaBC [Candidatus Coatesbacteria bacterium]